MLYELIEPYASVSTIGICKNAGKTTVLNGLIGACNKHGETIGLTSIGRDGERSDLVTNTKKPEIHVHCGTLFATAEKAIPLGTVSREILDVTPYGTPMGDVVLIRARSDGFIQIAGPSISTQLACIRDMLFSYGAKRVFLDGALGRRSLAVPSVSEALILSSGASYSPDMAKTVSDTAYCARIMSLPRTEYDVNGIEKKFSLIENGEILGFSELTEALDELRKKTYSALVLRGGITESAASQLLSLGKLKKETELIVEDGSKLLLCKSNFDKLGLAGFRFRVIKMTKLLAVTVNPFSAYGNHYDKNAFYDAVSEELPEWVKVINVFEEEGIC